ASTVSTFGVFPAMSMPTSPIASTATGLIASFGSEPADSTSTRSPARWRSHPAAICERPALCTQTNRTVGVVDISVLSPVSAAAGLVEHARLAAGLARVDDVLAHDGEFGAHGSSWSVMRGAAEYRWISM